MDEWNETAAIDWNLLSFDSHRQVQRFCRDLGNLYARLPALWQRDSEQDGFQWIEFRDVDNTTVSFVRYGEDPHDVLVVVLNMTPRVQYNYRLGVPVPGPWFEIMNSDRSQYGGSNVGNPEPLPTASGIWHDFPQSIALTLSPLGGCLLALRPVD